MKKSLIVFAIMTTMVVQGQNPFAEYGYKPKIATYSQGQFNEFHDLDTIVQIGSVLFNTRSEQIVAFVEKDTLNSEATLEPDIVSRWLSPDPLAAKYPSHSPYNFVIGNPIINIDPDGRKVVPVNEKTRMKLQNHLFDHFGDNVGFALIQAMDVYNNTGGVGTDKKLNRDASHINYLRQRSFLELVNSSNLSNADRALALQVYGILTNDNEHNIELPTSGDYSIDNFGGKYIPQGGRGDRELMEFTIDQQDVNLMDNTANGVIQKTDPKKPRSLTIMFSDQDNFLSEDEGAAVINSIITAEQRVNQDTQSRLNQNND